ncbi:TatD family hydrolase [Flavobacterium sp. K77]|uniref:TatD family hydrolase n=1 Tax=Flavobacterium sp. K77 TaxID=2910676 RepID=UPI001F16DEC7|nr:TatD family hydrolase [Flavobacterium sp. K77]MCF6141369.1 TatD family hydrolase [Flavobacterium sp. K77]
MEFFNAHTHQWSKQERVVELVNQYPQEMNGAIPQYSIGIHPWNINETRLAADYDIIQKSMSQPNCWAVGECGLDKRIEIPLPLQQQVFETQLLLAQEYNKPIIIHCVAAFQEVVSIKKKLQITVPLIIHGFSKNKAVARQLLDNGFYISFGKCLLRNPGLEEVFASIPNNRFFLETDTVEEGIEAVYELAARYKNTTVAAIQTQIQTNLNTVFGPKI